MNVTEEQKRSALLLGVAVVIIALIAGVFLFFLQNDEEGGEKVRKDLNAEDKALIAEKLTDLTAIASNFGGKQANLTDDFMATLVQTVTENPEYFTSVEKAAGLAQRDYLGQASYPSDETIEINDLNLFMFNGYQGYSGDSIEVTLPDQYYLNSSGKKEVEATVTFTSTYLSYEAKLEKPKGADDNVDVFAWDNKTMVEKKLTRDVEMKVLMSEGPGPWHVSSISSISVPGVLAFDNRSAYDTWQAARVTETFEVPNYPKVGNEADLVLCLKDQTPESCGVV